MLRLYTISGLLPALDSWLEWSVHYGEHTPAVRPYEKGWEARV